MKKSEMDKLKEFASWMANESAFWNEPAQKLWELLEDFEVDPTSAKETAEKNEMNIEPHEPEEAFYSKYVYEILSHVEPCKGISQIDSNKYKPKRKWHKWSELKDKYFSKEEQKKMNEQVRKELEKDDKSIEE